MSRSIRKTQLLENNHSHEENQKRKGWVGVGTVSKPGQAKRKHGMSVTVCSYSSRVVKDIARFVLYGPSLGTCYGTNCLG